MNKFIFIGNLTKDVDFSKTNSGISVAKFTVAVQRNYANADGEREADFFNITTWRGQADTCQKYLRKGNKVYVEGQITNRSYDGQDGNKKYVTEYTAEKVEFLTPKKSDGSQAEQEPVAPQQAELQPIDDDSLPF